jgi:DNA-binding XRE family transcriptional regulator
MGMTRRTAIYRHFDADGVLLYVGQSVSPSRRLYEHVRASGWAKDTASISIQWFDSKEEAAEAERVAIRDEGPEFNVFHNIRYVAPPAIPLDEYEEDEEEPEEEDEIDEVFTEEFYALSVSEKLDAWLKVFGKRKYVFASEVGCAKSTLTEIMQGKYLPDLRLALAIEDATRRKVKCRDWSE